MCSGELSGAAHGAQCAIELCIMKTVCYADHQAGVSSRSAWESKVKGTQAQGTTVFGISSYRMQSRGWTLT